MEFSGESALEFGQPFPKELGKAVEELRNPIRDLAKRAEKFKKEKHQARPAKLLSSFISRNRARLLTVVKLVKRQASKNENLAKQAVKETLVNEAQIPSQAAEVVSENLVATTLSINERQAKKLLGQTLEAITLGDKDKKDFVNLVEETGRELVPAEPVIEAEYQEVEAEPEEVEYTPPSGPPGKPPEGLRRRFRFGGGRRRDRTAGEAISRREFLKRFLMGAGVAILGLSIATGRGKPWEGYPIRWGLDVVGLTGSGVKTGTEMLGRGAVGVETEHGRTRSITRDLAKKMFDGSYPAADYLERFIRTRAPEEESSVPKNMNTIASPENYNSFMKIIVDSLADETEERKIPPDQVEEKLSEKGHAPDPSKFLEWIVKSSKTSEPLTAEQLNEIIIWFEKETGLQWKTGR